MKIEMGESLFYSWLRHVKECQVVQLNWKVSSSWTLCHEDKLTSIMEAAATHFQQSYGYKIFKKNRNLSQLLGQGECDALGIALSESGNFVYAVDVAFHESGLNYGSREETVAKVIAKCIRTAMCLYGYTNTETAEIIFASPKINQSVLQDIMPCVSDANRILQAHGLHYSVRLIANEGFQAQVLNPILLVSDGVADTSELFLRSYQLLNLFDKPQSISPPTNADEELRIGAVARTLLRSALESGKISTMEVAQFCTSEYSKATLDLQYPLLTLAETKKAPKHYYATPITIEEQSYFLCCEWFENDRPYLMEWLNTHTLEAGKYFRDVDTGTLVRKRDHYAKLEQYVQQKNEWCDVSDDSSYAREYYLGQGNTCLFDISEEDVLKLIT